MRATDAGLLGEDIAAAELWHQGYAILARRYHTRYGEIDIVAHDPREDTLVFVEVKARRSDRFGPAIEAVTPNKQRRVAAMALDYLAWSGQMDARCRFDVVAIDGLGTARMTVHHITHAFVVDR